MVFRVSFLAAICCATATNLVPQTADVVLKLPSEESLLETFKQAVVLGSQGYLTGAALEKDFEIISSYLLPLLEMSWERPELTETLVSCMVTLAQNPSHTKMISTLGACQADFEKYARTDEEIATIAKCLKQLGAYYGPVSYPADMHHNNRQKLKRSKANLFGLVGAGVALVAIVVGSVYWLTQNETTP